MQIKILNYYIGRSIEFILLPKDLGNRKKFRSVMGVMVLTRHGAAFVSLPKGENRYRF
jgi:hypothetical protein